MSDLIDQQRKILEQITATFAPEDDALRYVLEHSEAALLPKIQIITSHF
jgi:hypothetical protein